MNVTTNPVLPYSMTYGGMVSQRGTHFFSAPKRKAFSTIKMYLAAVNQHLLVCRSMKGAHRLLPVSGPLVASWDWAVVLEGLKGPPFEPLEEADLKHLSFKTALLLALALAKHVSDIHALSVHPSCTRVMSGSCGAH